MAQTVTPSSSSSEMDAHAFSSLTAQDFNALKATTGPEANLTHNLINYFLKTHHRVPDSFHVFSSTETFSKAAANSTDPTANKMAAIDPKIAVLPICRKGEWFCVVLLRNFRGEDPEVEIKNKPYYCGLLVSNRERGLDSFFLKWLSYKFLAEADVALQEFKVGKEFAPNDPDSGIHMLQNIWAIVESLQHDQYVQLLRTAFQDINAVDLPLLAQLAKHFNDQIVKIATVYNRDGMIRLIEQAAGSGIAIISAAATAAQVAQAAQAAQAAHAATLAAAAVVGGTASGSSSSTGVANAVTGALETKEETE
ncbi:hypothetical protein HK098_005664 [Nowakowskiella sp. JEL0407]|nr:hypothetical protein HK098_005664 [Nowakowskiella sp. JEL0407]